MIDLSLVWAGIIAFGVFMYVVMDGFDLGIGILFPFFPERQQRDVMMNTVAPVWDGNETWLVLGGAGLYAAFPLAYGLVLSALYLPVIIMLVALVFRGVSFEFRFKAVDPRGWDLAFTSGSIITAFMQGVILGAFIQGIPVVNNQFAGDSFGWLTPFSLCAGLGVMVTYAALGCGWLILKTSRELQQAMFRLMPWLALALFAMFITVSLWTPLRDPVIRARWFSPQLLYFSPVPLLVLVSTIAIYRAVELRNQVLPFILTLALVALGYTGLLISLWPNIIPPTVTLWQAAAPESSQAFTLIGAAILLPVILFYTGLAYWVFRGKVHVGEGGYH